MITGMIGGHHSRRRLQSERPSMKVGRGRVARISFNTDRLIYTCDQKQLGFKVWLHLADWRYPLNHKISKEQLCLLHACRMT